MLCANGETRNARRNGWRGSLCGGCQSRTFTKLPGASSIGLSLPPPGLRAAHLARGRALLSQASQSGHQEPGCSVALASHLSTSAAAVGFGAGPVLILLLVRRVDHAGDVAGAGEHEASPARRRYFEPSSTDFAGAMWSSRVARL